MGTDAPVGLSASETVGANPAMVTTMGAEVTVPELATLSGVAQKSSGGGYRPMSPEQQAIEKLKLRCQLATMSASYAKDIVVAQMAKEPLPIGTIRAMFSEVAEQIHHFCGSKVKEV